MYARINVSTKEVRGRQRHETFDAVLPIKIVPLVSELENTPSDELQANAGNDGVEVRANQSAIQAAKVQDEVDKDNQTQSVLDEITGFTKTQIDTAVTNIANLADAKAMITRMARAIWALAKLEGK